MVKQLERMPFYKLLLNLTFYIFSNAYLIVFFMCNIFSYFFLPCFFFLAIQESTLSRGINWLSWLCALLDTNQQK